MPSKPRPTAPVRRPAYSRSSAPVERPAWFIPGAAVVIAAQMYFFVKTLLMVFGAPGGVLWMLAILLAFVPVVVIAAVAIAYVKCAENAPEAPAACVWALGVGLTGAAVTWFGIEGFWGWLFVLIAWFALTLLLFPPLAFNGNRLAYQLLMIFIFVGLVLLARRGMIDAVVDARPNLDPAGYEATLKELNAEFGQLQSERLGLKSKVYQERLDDLNRRRAALGPPPDKPKEP